MKNRERIAVLVTAADPIYAGGAERFFDGLVASLLAKGFDAELVFTKADEPDFDSILENYARVEALDLSGYDLVISTKAPTFAVKHRNHLLYLVHTIRVFYDMFDDAFPWADDVLRQQRQAIQDRDTAAIREIRHRFTIGHEVSERLRKYNGIEAEILHPPLGLNGFHSGELGNYFFLPGRLHSWKRVDLVISAVRASSLPLKLLIAGTGEAESELRTLAANDPRIEFLGRVTDAQLIELYANALAVPFVPVREDYGYITLEAFASGKAVITCYDSGEPLQFVKHEVTGLVCQSTPLDLCAALERMFSNRAKALEWGLRGQRSIAHITWSNVAERLLTAGFPDRKSHAHSSESSRSITKVAVLDMQPIAPAVGGGRLRLLGLYHDMGDGIQARYVGTYDWPGEKYRQHHITQSLEEIDVPLSAEHHCAADLLAQQSGGKTVIDIAFPRLCHLSPDYLAKVGEAIEWADVVMFSHPWVYPLVAHQLKPSQLIVYDSHNVEGYLRAQLLDENNPVEAQLLREVVQAEYTLGRRADIVLACSHEDLSLFVEIYEWSANKIRIVPNAVMASKIVPPDIVGRMQSKKRVGLAHDRKAAIFIGSAYQPNAEAANFIVNELAPQLPYCDFVIAGGVGAAIAEAKPPNVFVTGVIDDEQRLCWLQAADFAVNPMFSGSGTNIKMFDFMAAGLPVISTQVGARGIVTAGRQPLIVVNNTPVGFRTGINKLINNPSELIRLSSEARACVEEDYSWERISTQLGRLIVGSLLWHGRRKPLFSVIIPTYERHDQLDAIVCCLQAQVERDFEVVMVDQSKIPWARQHEDFGFPLKYIHTTVKGAVRARNTGAFYAQGQNIAFTDDDCRPFPDWLCNAVPFFSNPAIVGVEGLIESDHLDDPNFRPVTNVGFEGIGFMTANLLVRSDAFHRLGGFDLNFDRPHFREDTDFGWRLQTLGSIPYAGNVRVFHPAQPRVVERESFVERAKFFEKDALLFQKHPKNYMRLFWAEGHWNKTKGFWENINRGAEKYAVDITLLNEYQPNDMQISDKLNSKDSSS